MRPPPSYFFLLRHRSRTNSHVFRATQAIFVSKPQYPRSLHPCFDPTYSHASVISHVIEDRSKHFEGIEGELVIAIVGAGVLRATMIRSRRSVLVDTRFLASVFLKSYGSIDDRYGVYDCDEITRQSCFAREWTRVHSRSIQFRMRGKLAISSSV